MLTQPETDAGPNVAVNYMLVKNLQTLLSKTEMNARLVPEVMGEVIAQSAWREWVTMEGSHYQWNAADFRTFLESPRPAGCQTPIHVIRRALAGTTVEVDFERLVRGEPGGTHNPGGINQWSEVNRNNVPDDHPATIVLSPDVPRPTRNYARESKQGNSVGYALRRLETNRPDLLEMVRAGELSPHGAMVLAGFRPKAITIPADPANAARRLLLHFKGSDLDALIAELQAQRSGDHA